ncbi:DedA family protein [Clostridium beijerinckii]|uniref:Inner membrane protein YqjA n=1 Tax=Clostridium beijerinckii TaxID=1520 RepID=A0A1S8RLK1_CLOBE|nr:DedA family protein [Clostridium beijerinckii]NRY63156.1 membrane protein DedA with SNARE-associated domain [Clostridium beijerinckii]OOM54003.1 inner membrane protein YqjA [Clostridium beijerinckii]
MEVINYLTNYITYIVNEIGYVAVVIITAMEYAGFPMMPSEVILPAIGILAAKGEITYLGALSFSILGGLIGSLLCYFLGYYGGGVLIEKIILKFPKTKKNIETINNWFEKYGKLAIFFARLVPLTRTYISIIAGTAKFNKKTFILFSVMGIIIWNSILVSLGYFIGHNWSYIHLIIKQYSIFASIIIFTVILLVIYKKLISRKPIN